MVEEKELKGLRQKPAVTETEPHALVCDGCKHMCTVSGRIDAAFRHGFQRLLKTDTPSPEERLRIIWDGLLKPPQDKSDLTAMDKWRLYVAFIQDSVKYA